MSFPLEPNKAALAPANAAPEPDAALTPEPTSHNADSLAINVASMALAPDAVPDAVPENAMTEPVIALAPEPEPVNPETRELNAREAIEKGLMAFNQLSQTSDFYGKAVAGIESAIRLAQPTIAFVNLTAAAQVDSGDVIVSYCNPSIGALSDFTPHYNLFISTHLPANVPPMSIMTPTFDALNALRKLLQPEDGAFEIKVSLTSHHHTGPRISLRLHIGPVFNIPVFTAHVMNHVLNNPRLPGALAPIEPEPFVHNAKPIGPYNRLDLMMELLLHSETTDDDPYSPVNVLIARGINVSCVKKFTTVATGSGPSPNAIIRAECDAFFELLIMSETQLIQSALTKSVLIAVMQNPTVLTSDGKQFSDIFPSGQYGNYFDELAYKTKQDEAGGAIMLDDGSPLTRTDMIVAALTAVNEAMRSSGVHIVAGGGAAVSYYIRDFLGNAFSPEIVAASGVDLAQVKERCGKIMMNDIDCFVFGNVSRQFLLLFSLYMMILYDNFYERAKRYGIKEAIATQGTKIEFKLSADDRIGLFMYGNRNEDANTQLISKRLAKNPKVQLVTQETKCFSQIEHPLCGPIGDACKVDGYYLQPVDLVKKDIEEFVDLYVGSLYPAKDGVQRPADLEAMILRQYTTDNMVSLKTTMLDIICIFCDEGKSLFIRIFMARKNPKDFARLRAFIDLYLLQLLQANPAPAFAETNKEFIQLVGQLRAKMDQLDETYYLKQGNIAATNAATAEQIDEDRTAFLMLLRNIGRKIVELPDPFGDVVPIKFQAAPTGANMIRFFKENTQMTYNFDMSQHMTQLFSIYREGQAGAYTRWLNGVFSQIKFPPESETFFRSKLDQILNPVDPDGNRKIGFKEMPEISPLMLRLHDALKRVKVSQPLILRFRPMFNSLVQPIKEQIRRGANPTAYYVGVRNKTSKKTQDGVYDAETKKRLFPTFVTEVILKNEAMKNPIISGLIHDLKENANAKYDDVVMEEIGRILLDYEPNITKLGGGGGGKTRKRSPRMVRRHPKTRNCNRTTLSKNQKTRRHRRRCTNLHKNKQTRKYIDVMDGMH